MPKKCILIVLDGLSGRSFAELGHMTPLQAARTPVLDGLARYGANGLYHPSNIGQIVPDLQTSFPLFGYDMKEFPGRGPLEALGAGINIRQSDVAICSRLTCLKEVNGVLFVETEIPPATEDEISTLISSIRKFKDSGTSIHLHRTTGFEGILTLRGRVSPCITDSHPIHNGSPLTDIVPLQKHIIKPEARNSARTLKRYCIKIFNQLNTDPVNLKRKDAGLPPLNGLLTRDAGQLKNPSPFLIRYGLRGLSIATGLACQGLSMYLGLDYIPVTTNTDPGTNLSARLRIAREEMSHYDFIHIHTAVPDTAQQTNNPGEKIAFIESLDTVLGQELEPFVENKDVLVIIASQHTEPVNGNIILSGKPLPILFCGDGLHRDPIIRYDEVSAAAGCLGLIRGKELFYLAINYIDRCKLTGIISSTDDQEFWPGNYPPFKV